MFDIEVKPSRTLLHVTIVLHVGAFACAFVVLNDWTQLGLTGVIIGFTVFRVLRAWGGGVQGLRTLKRLRFRGGSLSELTALDDGCVTVAELQHTRAWPWLVQLTVRDENGLHVHLVPYDSVENENWWRLRVYLRRSEAKIAR